MALILLNLLLGVPSLLVLNLMSIYLLPVMMMWLSMPWLAPLFFLTITCIPTWFTMLLSYCIKVWRTVLPVVIWMPCVLFIVVGTVRRSLNNFLDEWLAIIFMAVMTIMLSSRC